jgi:hypothetical protein
VRSISHRAGMVVMGVLREVMLLTEIIGRNFFIDIGVCVRNNKQWK